MKEMALARIRQLSAHEVGHTLGIAHNFAASADNRASVMDYPHPLVKIVNDKIDLSQAYAVGMGEWDKHVVAYGYSDFAADEAQQLNAIISSAQQNKLQYISDADARPKSGGHASAHLWDNGENPAVELNRVMQVRAKALSDFGINSIATGTPLSQIEEALVPIYNFHRYQVEAAAKLIAGIDYSYEVKTAETPKGVTMVSAKAQQQAIDALLATLSAETLTLSPQLIALIPPKAYGYYRSRESFQSNTGLAFDPVSAASASAKHTIALMLNKGRLARLAQQHQLQTDISSVGNLITQLNKATLQQPTNSGLAVLVQQRVNQQVVDHLIALNKDASLVPEVKAEVTYQLREMLEQLEDQADSRKYKALSTHFMLLHEQITYALEHKEAVQPMNDDKLPPGSPIGNE